MLKDTVRVLAVVVSLQSSDPATLSVKAAKSHLHDYFHGVKANTARQYFPGTRLGKSASNIDSATQQKVQVQAKTAGIALASVTGRFWQTIQEMLTRVAFVDVCPAKLNEVAVVISVNVRNDLEVC